MFNEGDMLTNKDLANELNRVEMTREDFLKLSNFITANYGIKLPEVKRVMLQSRLQKRLRILNMNSFDEYCEYVFKKGNEDEIIHMIDLVSTNKTDFFREPGHFEFLKNSALPDIIQRKKLKLLKIWSAGCSSGEEPYSIAIALSEYLKIYPGIEFSILGTDISARILNKAIEGIYEETKIDMVPIELKKRYFLRSKDRNKKKVRVVKELRGKVSYQRLNLMDNYYEINENFDLIFCRNVLIYFDRANQEKIINRLCMNLKKGGYFFLGHSESVLKMDIPLKQIKPSTFIKTI